jgi:fructose-1,6-bisphosphatase/inositol monophosphatase family enzyme
MPSFIAHWLRRYRLRRMGSTALSLCYVAFGALAFVHDHRVSVWDIAGAVPVVIEAGGALTTPEGASFFPLSATAPAPDSLALLAGDPLAHHQGRLDIRAARRRTGG